MKFSNWVMLLCGFTSGVALTNVLGFYPRRFHVICISLVLASLLGQWLMMWLDWRSLRAAKKELIEDGDRLLELARADLKERHPDDPVFVAGVMLKLQEEMSNLLSR